MIEPGKEVIVSKKQNKTKIKINKGLDNFGVSIFMTTITVYTLFFDDIRTMFIPKVADDAFYGITTFCMLCFSVEIIFAAYAKEGYVFGFFFWLDVMSTLSMVFDIGWII